MNELSAAAFTERLFALQSDEVRRKNETDLKLAADQASDDYTIGVRMGSIFGLGKEFAQMSVGGIETLLESPIHEMRVGAMSIMGQCAKGKKCSDERLKDLYELYLRRHDRINHWGLVDLAAYYVVGRYLADKPRDVLYELARSQNRWERRTAIVATAHFILKLKQVNDTFDISEILVHDAEKFVQTGTGWMLRAAGDVDRPRLIAFLDKHATTMPRVLLRYSIEKLEKGQRTYYLGIKKRVTKLS